ncbi:hypothetical protein JR316_0012811 [Psilocybe cubensis]|uniref:Uncharacterized protein n=1 Tax=Psilocybe cubensis TaxID=181762 RepID=A0ACB8GFI3_PSICU|nr:hypothetical protein JR316_0012811 [Psilocybe cubensis]KAH9474353.1 hypothetical protein JR316_0012811 [Psilocybe cubensis]
MAFVCLDRSEEFRAGASIACIVLGPAPQTIGFWGSGVTILSDRSLWVWWNFALHPCLTPKAAPDVWYDDEKPKYRYHLEQNTGDWERCAMA